MDVLVFFMFIGIGVVFSLTAFAIFILALIEFEEIKKEHNREDF